MYTHDALQCETCDIIFLVIFYLIYIIKVQHWFGSRLLDDDTCIERKTAQHLLTIIKAQIKTKARIIPSFFRKKEKDKKQENDRLGLSIKMRGDSCF